MKFLKKNTLPLILITFIFSFFVFVPVLSLADTHNIPPCPEAKDGKLCNPVPIDSIPAFIKILLEGVLKIGMPLIALAIIYCGFLFVEARGNPEKISQAKKALTYTVIGAAILLGSWAIAKLISDTVLSLSP
jgi:hypothetical protein